MYEVSNQLQVRSLIPWIAAVLQLLQAMLELAQDFTDKVRIPTYYMTCSYVTTICCYTVCVCVCA